MNVKDINTNQLRHPEAEENVSEMALAKEDVKLVDVEAKVVGAEGGGDYLPEVERAVEVVGLENISYYDESVEYQFLFDKSEIDKKIKKDYDEVDFNLEQLINDNMSCLTENKKAEKLVLMAQKFVLNRRLELSSLQEIKDEKDSIMLFLYDINGISSRGIKTSYSVSLGLWKSNDDYKYNTVAAVKRKKLNKLYKKFINESKKNEEFYAMLKNATMSSHEDVNTLSDFHDKVLACFCLYPRRHVADLVGSDSAYEIVNQNISLLELYIDRSIDELKRKCISQFQADIIQFLLCDLLALYFNAALNQFNVKDVVVLRDRYNKRVGLEIIDNCKQCLKMIEVIVSNKIHFIADLQIIKTLRSCIMRFKQAAMYNKKLLIVPLLEIEIMKCNNADSKRKPYSCLIFVAELVGSLEFQEKYLEAASKYTLFPLFFRLWNDFGLVKRINNISASSAFLNVERAIDTLIELNKQSDRLLIMKDEMEEIHESIIIYKQIKTDHDAEWARRLALYFYLIKDFKKGNDLMKFGNFDCVAFYHALTSIASEQFGLAISFLDKVEADKKHPSYFIPAFIPLKGMLFKKIADQKECSDLKKNEGYEIALSYLNQMKSTRPELLQPIAYLQGRLGHFSDSYQSYTALERELKKFKQTSYEHCQLKIIQEIRKKLKEDHSECADDNFEENIDKVVKVNIESESEGVGKAKAKAKTKTKAKAKAKAKEIKNPSSNARSENKPVDCKSAITGDGDEISNQSLDIVASGKDSMILRESVQIGKLDKVETTMFEEIKTEVYPLSLEEEEINQQQFVIVNRKKTNVHSFECLRLSAIRADEYEFSITRQQRHELYHELLYSNNINYKVLVEKHDMCAKACINDAMLMLFSQNKVWCLRHKTFNFSALSFESYEEKVSIDKLKIDTRKSMLCILYSSIEKASKLWEAEGLSSDWKVNPMIINNDRFKDYLKCSSGRFSKMLGSLFSTVAHVMQDIYYDQPKGNKYKTESVKLYEKHPSRFLELSDLYYAFRNTIDPEHSSR
ncbi:MAG: hypothetical protein KAG53_09585 [Endozoicomonadaceae bacterium]|nr:hypothetical protein [Endozoicomonadaceae bacterium]